MAEHNRILIVDDERMICEAVSSYLTKKGYETSVARTGKEALELFFKREFDFLILDLMLPDLSGEEVCAKIRQTSKIPIIMLTAKSQEDDLLNGPAIGADDYITKSFSLKELHARVETVLRRATNDASLTSVFHINGEDLVVDIGSRRVQKAGIPVDLTPMEWNILSALIKRPKKVFSREELLAIAFDDDFDGYDRVIDTHIKNLRKKIEDDTKKPIYILTVHGAGYRFGG